MTDRLPVRKMNPVCDGKWAGIDVAELLGHRERRRALTGRNSLPAFDDTQSRKLGIDVASIRRLAGEGEK